MKDISFQKAITKTMIEVDDNFTESVWDSLVRKTRNHYVPPLFSEFTIKFTERGKGRAIIQTGLSNNIGFLSLPVEKREKFIDEIIINNPYMTNDVVTYYSVMYVSATEWVVVVFEGERHTKTWIVECSYINEPDEYGNNYSINVISTCEHLDFDKVPDEVLNQMSVRNVAEYAQRIGAFALDIVNVISYYMQHYNPDVEYSLIKATPLKKTKDGTKTKGNLGYEQKIVLKSKIKKYVLTSDTHKTNIKKMRTYRKTKPCWYVRGYYQHFGNEKILKYIPPRINYRKDLKTSELPAPNTYTLKKDEKG